MAKKSLFSPRDLYNIADSIVEMYDRLNLVFKFATAEGNQTKIDAYSGMIWELNLLIESYGLREMTKIDG
jgi:hypothetical protein